MQIIKSNLSGWGISHSSACSVFMPFQSREIENLYKNLSTEICFRGSGLAYGDAGTLENGCVVDARTLNKFISYDKHNGTIECQGGMKLCEIIDLIVRDNWMLGVVPGTPRATVGGCIACDVHGKNHSFANTGSFGNWIIEIELLTVSEGIIKCSPFFNEDIYWATIGGMGLTGLILSSKIKLRKIVGSNVTVKNIPTTNLCDTINLLSNDQTYEHRVAWIDGLKVGKSLGSGFVSFGNYIECYNNVIPQISERGNMPFPQFSSSRLVNKFSLKVFNKMILQFNHNPRSKIIKMTDFLFPFEKIPNWNKLFFSKGIVEYQVVVPERGIHEFTDWFLKEILKRNLSPYLVSMKKFGNESKGYISFPAQGFAFSASFSKFLIGLTNFLDDADKKLANLSGRVYLAKDCRLRPEIIEHMYPKIPSFRKVCDSLDPRQLIQTDLSKRLKLRGI